MYGYNHIHGPNGRHLRRIVTTALLNEVEELYDAGGHNRGAVVWYMERTPNLRINVSSLRTRISAQCEKVHPRAAEAARLVETLSVYQASEPTLRWKDGKNRSDQYSL